MRAKLKRVKLIGLFMLGICFLWPNLLKQIALTVNIIRAILGHLIIKLWSKGGVYSGKVSSLLHKSLRGTTTKKDQKDFMEFIDRLDFPE